MFFYVAMGTQDPNITFSMRVLLLFLSLKKKKGYENVNLGDEVFTMRRFINLILST